MNSIATTRIGIDLRYPPTRIKDSPNIIMPKESDKECFLPIRYVNIEKMSMPPIDPTNTKDENRVIVL